MRIFRRTRETRLVLCSWKGKVSLTIEGDAVDHLHEVIRIKLSRVGFLSVAEDADVGKMQDRYFISQDRRKTNA